MRHPARLALALLVTLALLAGARVTTPTLAAPTSRLAQATPPPDTPRFPLYFFLLKPNPQFAQVMAGLNLTSTQAMGLGMALADEARLLSVSQARGTISLDVGPIAQATWGRLERDVLTREQYETLRRWTATQDEFLVGVLRDVAAGSTALATAAVTTGAPTVPPPIRDFLAALQTPAVTPAVSTPAANATAASTSAPATSAPATATSTPATATTGPATAVPATATSIPATGTSVPPTTPPPTATPVPATAATSAASTATTATPAPARPAARGAALSSLTVVGQGRAEATPNVAHLSLGVETISDTVRAASNDVNQKATAINNRLKSLGIADKDIQTAQYSISPYQPPTERPLGPATVGPTPTRPRPQYRVSATVRVTVRNLNLVGQAIDGAIDAGATNVGGIQFTLEDPTPTLDQARENAYKDAVHRAQQLATLAGHTLGPPIYVTEVIGSTPPIARADAARGAAPAALAAAPPPIEGGELSYTTQLQVTFELR